MCFWRFEQKCEKNLFPFESAQRIEKNREEKKKRPIVLDLFAAVRFFLLVLRLLFRKMLFVHFAKCGEDKKVYKKFATFI